MISFSKLLKENQFPRLAALLLLLILLVIGAVPGYITGHWQWQKLPPITTIKQLRQLRHQGLNLPGWQTIEKSQQQIGGHKWLMQVIKKQGTQTQATLLLLPQTDSKNQPEVEWTEIESWQQWNVAQYRLAEFTVKQPSTQVKVEAQFFRASTMKQTFAVLQWYAFPNGGNPSPIRWFAADQLAQLRKQRAPWVCVSIMIPMEPLGQVETTWSLTKSIGETVQGALMGSFL
ncbi:cyanoexosortase B system-associated protein [Scytonema hofmannii FACHB-248]|uniref:Cyanoexosortase B system-associated protein n=1 Tax=Scytonema hofmannii FACHB-248 TaxID=1842502 RepID=A0ABR8GUK0_9CYAN|nr:MULTISPECIES: cyanoexosortase B system-associated protein [Nostocales]MBD2606820.1 cyanoexosortase B system-associated protein [Scytonema hofmannii FACHB-248]